jgi:hypothetical protein
LQRESGLTKTRAYAGQTEELRFQGGGLLDNVLFSSQAIPELATWRQKSFLFIFLTHFYDFNHANCVDFDNQIEDLSQKNGVRKMGSERWTEWVNAYRAPGRNLEPTSPTSTRTEKAMAFLPPPIQA